MSPIEIVTIFAVAFCVVVVLGTLKNNGTLSAIIVGVSGALVGIQVFQVHIFTIAVVIWVLVSRSHYNMRSTPHVAQLLASAGILALTVVTGDLVGSPTLALQLLALAASATLIASFSTEEDRRNMITGLLLFATLSSLLGLLQVLKIAPVEIWHASVSAIGRPIGLYPEPDWLGLFAGLGMVIAWRVPIRRGWRTAAITVNAAAFVLAFARAAWVGVVASVILVIVIAFFSRQQQKTRTAGRRGALGLLALGTLGVLLFLPQLVTDLTTRLANTLSPGSSGPDISGQARVNQIASLIELAQSAPFYGHGLSASGRVRVFGGIDASHGGNAVSSNWLLGMWVDGALLALPIVAFFIFVALRMSATLPGQLLVIVLINSLFSNAFFFPITWILVALCLGGLLERRSVQAKTRPLSLPPDHVLASPSRSDPPLQVARQIGNLSKQPS